MTKKKCKKTAVKIPSYERKSVKEITNSIKQSLNTKFSTGCIPLLTISSKYLNTIIPTTNQIILNDLSFSVSSTQKISNISFNTKPSFVGDNVQSFLEGSSVHLRHIKNNKVIVLSYLHEWKNSNVFLNKNGYYYVSLTQKHKGRSDEDDLIVMMLGVHRKSRCQPDQKIITEDFINTLHKNKSVNMRGDGKKHHQSMGTYFGIGIINKYSKEKIGVFSNTKAKDSNNIQINELQNNVKTMFLSLHNSINSVIPNITQASFSLLNVLVKIVKTRRKGEYSHSINIMKKKMPLLITVACVVIFVKMLRQKSTIKRMIAHIHLLEYHSLVMMYIHDLETIDSSLSGI